MILQSGVCMATQFFSSAKLTPEEWNRTKATRISCRRVPKGETLYHAGQPFEHLSAIRTGYFRTGAVDKSGDTSVFGFHLPGEMLGADRLFGGPQDADTVALVDSDVCSIDAEEIQQLISEVPAIDQFFHQFLVRDVHRMRQFLAVLSQRTAEQRLASFLINFGKRLHRRGYSPIEFQLPMTRSDMAAYLLLQPETVSRALKVLACRGHIAVDNRNVKILQLDALREFRGKQLN